MIELKESPLGRALQIFTIPDAWRRLGLSGEPKVQGACHSPFREDRQASFCIFRNSTLYKDQATGECGNVVAFVMKALGISRSEAARKVISWAGTGRGGSDNSRSAVAIAKRVFTTEKPKQPSIPTLRPLTYAEEKAIENQRQFSTSAGITIAQEHGLLFAGKVWDDGQYRECWILTDASRRNAQARRMDGKPFTIGGKEVKTKTLPGCSQAWPIGIANTRGARCIIVTEGPPDTLSSISMAWYCRDGQIDDLAFVSVCGAGNSIHPDALPLFKGKNVRIVYHQDPAGIAALSNWTEQLLKAGAFVDAFTLDGLRKSDGTPANDLNDVCWFEPYGEDEEPKFQAGLEDLFNFEEDTK